ncbi:unnamed protein product, partial [Phaeothamnion confervicola]
MKKGDDAIGSLPFAQRGEVNVTALRSSGSYLTRKAARRTKVSEEMQCWRRRGGKWGFCDSYLPTVRSQKAFTKTLRMPDARYTVIIVSQFRPPVASAVVESPAGLVDAGEDAATAASRELREETGFSGTISFVSPIVPSDPGMSEANMRYVCMLVDGDAPENRSPKPEPEDGEHITVGRVPASRMLEALHDLAQAPSGSAEDGGSGGGGSGEKLLIDARMYALALGYHLAD